MTGSKKVGKKPSRLYLSLLVVLVILTTAQSLKLKSRDLPKVKINGDSVTFKPYHFIDFQDFKSLNSDGLQVTASTGQVDWADEGFTLDIPFGLPQNANFMKFVEVVPQGLLNLGTLKYFYEPDEKKDSRCVFLGLDYPNIVWEEQLEITEEQCHQADISQSNEDDVVLTWITHKGEGEAAKRYINLVIKELATKEKISYQFEDDQNIFTEKSYVTSRFVRYVDQKGATSLEQGLLGLIYTRIDNKNGKIYTIKKVDLPRLSAEEKIHQAPVQNIKIGKVTLDSGAAEKLYSISCNFDKEFEVSPSAVISCYGNSKSAESAFSDLTQIDFSFDQPSPKEVKSYPASASEKSMIQCGVLSCQKENSILKYNDVSKEIEIKYADPYTKKQMTKTSAIDLSISSDEYIHSMIANSEWFEIQIRKKGAFYSPRRFIGSTEFKKLVPSSFIKSQLIDPKTDSFILSVQNAQIGESVYSRAGFFGLSLIAREFAKISILYDVEYYLTIKKNPQEITEGVNQDSQKTVKITYTDKATQESVSLDLQYEFINDWFIPKFSNPNKEGLSYELFDTFDNKDDVVNQFLPLTLEGDYVITPAWSDKPKDQNPNVTVKMYPSYNTKHEVSGSVYPKKLHDIKNEDKSVHQAIQIDGLGFVNIECDGNQLAYINYLGKDLENSSSVGMNIRSYGIPCELIYARQEIKSFLTEFKDKETSSYIYYIIRFMNTTGKGDFVIRRIYNNELFDQIRHNAFEIDDMTIGSLAFDDQMQRKYTTFFTFNKTFLKIEYLNGDSIEALNLLAINRKTNAELKCLITVDLVNSTNIGPPIIREKEKRIKVSELTKFVGQNTEQIFSFDDFNSLVTDLTQINPKFKTSLTYEIDVNAPVTGAPSSFKSSVIVQILTDKREKVNKDQSSAVDSKLVFQLTQDYTENKSHLEIDHKYKFLVWNTNNKADKWNEWTKVMEYSTEGSIHQVDFIDLRSEVPEKDGQDFLIYGLFRKGEGLAQTPNSQFFTLFKDQLNTLEVPNQVILVSIYIVSKTFFIGTDSEGNIHKYSYEQGNMKLTELSSLPEEQGADFGRMGKITFLDNILVIFAPSKSQSSEKLLNVFVYDAKTGDSKFVENKLPITEYQELEFLQSIHMTINPNNKLLLFDLVLNSAVRTIFKVFQLKITQDEKGFAIEPNTGNYAEGCSEPYTDFSKPVLMDDIKCLTTDKFVVCFVHSFVNGQSGNYFLSWKKYSKCTETKSALSLSQDDKKKVSYTYRQTKLKPQSALSSFSYDSYRFNEIIFIEQKTGAAKDHVVKLTRLDGKLVIKKEASAAEDKNIKISDLSLIFNEINYWSSTDAKIDAEQWIEIGNSSTKGESSKLLLWILIVCGVIAIGGLIFFCFVKKQRQQLYDDRETYQMEIDDEKYNSMDAGRSEKSDSVLSGRLQDFE